MAKLFSAFANVLDSPAIGEFPAKRKNFGNDLGNLDQPKLKFLFTVQFFPTVDMKLENIGSQSMSEITLSLVKASRLNATIHYEDANYYSFRTKVATRTEYGKFDITFYDDIKQRAHKILTSYLNYVSPISKIPATSSSNLQDLNLNAATIGAITRKLGPLHYIRLTHYSIYEGSTLQYVTYDFLNPKVSELSLDELTMEDGGMANVKLSFHFDSVNINYSVDEQKNQAVNTNPSSEFLNMNNGVINNGSPFLFNQGYTATNIVQQNPQSKNNPPAPVGVNSFFANAITVS